jgi:hypothetical protein
MSLLKLGTVTSSGVVFKLPLELVTQSIAILAKRGVGKTYTAAVLCEEIHDAGVPPIIIDPTGAQGGLKASADGKRAGLPFVVFGGEHADLPLEEGAGEVIARAIVDQRFPAILDLSLFRKAAMHRFLVGFFETLYRLNRQALHLVCDEADAYAPQKPFGEEARTLGAMQDIVRRGRIRGIGCTLITQRPQVLNKDVLTQCEVLVTMRLVHPKDVGAIQDWIAVHGDPALADKLIASLPSLPVGHAWFWAPGFGDLFERVHIRQRRTFDSSATPKPGEVRVAPEKFAEVDLSKLGGEIAAAAQRAKENDPAELKRQVAELKKQLAAMPAAPAERFEVKVPDVERLRDIRIICRDLSSTIEAMQTPMVAQLETLRSIGGVLAANVAAIGNALGEFAGRDGATPSGTDRGQAPRETVSARPVARDARSRTASAGDSDSDLGKAERRVLAVLAQHGPCERGKLALLAGYSYSGGFRNTLSALRSADFLVGGNEEVMAITDLGREALGSFDELPTGAALGKWWLQSPQFGQAERVVLATLLDHPEGFSGYDLAKACGYEFSGGFRNALSTLRTAGVIVGRNNDVLRANPELFTA